MWQLTRIFCSKQFPPSLEQGLHNLVHSVFFWALHNPTLIEDTTQSFTPHNRCFCACCVLSAVFIPLLKDQSHEEVLPRLWAMIERFVRGRLKLWSGQVCNTCLRAREIVSVWMSCPHCDNWFELPQGTVPETPLFSSFSLSTKTLKNSMCHWRSLMGLWAVLLSPSHGHPSSARVLHWKYTTLNSQSNRRRGQREQVCVSKEIQMRYDCVDECFQNKYRNHPSIRRTQV